MDLNQTAEMIYQTATSKGFWDFGDAPENLILSTKLALVHSEVSEVLEALRKGELDELPHEFADIIIRVLDLTQHLDIDIEDAIKTKMEKNSSRPHMHGKKF